MPNEEPFSVRCSRCQALLPVASYRNDEMVPCPSCSSALQVYAFPALFRPVEAGKTGDLVIVDGESSCFYHPEKKAVVTCSYCGRFLCALCDVDFNGEHLCPPCIESGKKKGK